MKGWEPWGCVPGLRRSGERREIEMTSYARRMAGAMSLAAVVASAMAGRPGGATAEAAQQAAPAPAEGTQTWIGAVELPGGMRLEFSARLTPDGKGGFAGEMDIPSQDVHGMALRDIAVEPGAMRFTLAPGNAPANGWAIFEVTMKEDGGVESASMSQFGQTFAVILRRGGEGEDAEAAMRPQTPRGAAPYAQRELSLVNGADGTRLVGTLFVPGKPEAGELVSGERHPAVILITGSGAQDRDESLLGHKPFLVIADHLARRGIASLRMDDRGVGGSSGSVTDSTVYDFAGDVRTAFNALRLQPDIDPDRIGVLGHSEGGMVAAQAASETPEIRFVVMLAGTGVPGREVMGLQARLIALAAGADEETLAKQDEAHRALMDALAAGAAPEVIDEAIRALVVVQTGGQGAPEEQMGAVIESQRRLLTSAWARAFLAYDPRVALRGVKCSVLAINGEKDLQISADQNLTAIEAALKEGGNRAVTVKRLAGLNHLFQRAETGLPTEYGQIRETMAPEVLEMIAEWIRKRVGL